MRFQAAYGVFYAGKFVKESQPGRNLKSGLKLLIRPQGSPKELVESYRRIPAGIVVVCAQLPHKQGTCPDWRHFLELDNNLGGIVHTKANIAGFDPRSL